MQRTPVTSSNLVSVGYNASSQTLEVEFKNGGIYQYDEIPLELYTGIMSAASAGRYFHQNIRGKYQARKIS